MDSASLTNDRNDYRGYYFLTAVVVLLLDQATKAMVSRTIPLYDSIPIVPRFFSITHVLNPGAAFSLFAESSSHYTTAALIIFSVDFAVHVHIAHDGLHVFARLSERYGLHKLLGVPVLPMGPPIADPICAGIVGGQRVLNRPAVLIQYLTKIAGAQLDVRLRL